MAKLTHIDDNNRPTMVDVGDKAVTRREATARTEVSLPPDVLAAIDGDEIQSKKGPVFATAIIAGVMAAKKTHELIPFCHPLGLEKCTIDIHIDGDKAVIEATCRCRDGSADSRLRRCTDDIRHVQGPVSRHGDRQHTTRRQERRQKGLSTQ